MKKILIAILIWLPLITNANTYIERNIQWYKIKVIEYNTKSDLYDIQFLKSNSWTQEPLNKILSDNNAISWVNWIFFCPEYYSFCKWKEWTTNNERYFKWVKYEWYETSWDKPMFVIDKDKKSFIYKADEINTNKESEIYYWLSNRPLILKDWQNQLETYWEQWLIDSKMSSYWTKNFICNTKDNSKIYFWLVYSINIDSMPSLLLELGCNDALNLDAWLSTSFVYNWKYLVWPQRNVIDWIWIIPKFNINDLNNKASLVVDILYKRVLMKAKMSENQLKILESYNSQLNNIKQKIYEIYSNDIFDTNSLIWEKEKVWYKIEINNEKNLKIIYLLNKINYWIKNKINELKENLTLTENHE